MESKDWTGNSVAYQKTNGFANNSQQDRETNDYYATEPKALLALMDLEYLTNVWECACGEGHLAEVLRKDGELGKASDLIDRGYGEVFDFLADETTWDGDIVTNPPYKHAEKFIRRAYSYLRPKRKLAMFLPIRYLEGKARKKMFEELPPKTVYVFSYRVKCAINGEFDKMTGSAVSYAWYVWEKGYKGETIIKWI